MFLFQDAHAVNEKYVVRRSQRLRRHDKLPGVEPHGPALVSGILVPELTEEVVDAYDDLLTDIGLAGDDDDDGDDLPSCLPLLMIDYVIFNFSLAIQNVKNKKLFS